MRFLATLLPMAILVILIGAGSAQEKKADDAKNLQGTWSVVSMEPNGQKLTAEDLKKMKMVIEGSTLTFDDGKKKEKSKFKLDASKKPKHIDFQSPEGRDDGVKGIYELDGDNLKLCFLDDKGKRPTNFATELTVRPSPVLMVLKR